MESRDRIENYERKLGFILGAMLRYDQKLRDSAVKDAKVWICFEWYAQNISFSEYQYLTDKVVEIADEILDSMEGCCHV